MGISRQEYWSGVPLPSPQHLLNDANVIEPMLSLKDIPLEYPLLTKGGMVIPICHMWEPLTDG